MFGLHRIPVYHGLVNTCFTVDIKVLICTPVYKNSPLLFLWSVIPERTAKIKYKKKVNYLQ